MIKRYDILVYNTEFGPAYEMIDGLTWCLSEDVEALETETAELRERVGELEEWQRKAISHFNCLNGIHPHNIGGVLQQWSDIFDFINAVESSPLDVEKGEKGNGNN